MAIGGGGNARAPIREDAVELQKMTRPFEKKKLIEKFADKENNAYLCSPKP